MKIFIVDNHFNQTAKLFFNICPFITMKICPNLLYKP